jgi:uncharacterized RDD family membrane protein YckC
MLAYAIDSTIMWVTIIAIWIGLLVGIPALLGMVAEPISRWFRDRGSTPIGSGWIMIVLAAIWFLQFAVEVGYFVFFEWMTDGRSPGKRWLGLRVVKDGGFPIDVRQSLIRNLMRAVDGLPWSYVVGLVAMLISSDGKRLGDLAAGTVVVRLDRPARPEPLPELAPDTVAAFTFDRAQLARIGAAEVTLAMETLRRLESLDEERAADALERAATALATRLGRPPVEPHERAAFLRALVDAAI